MVMGNWLGLCSWEKGGDHQMILMWNGKITRVYVHNKGESIGTRNLEIVKIVECIGAVNGISEKKLVTRRTGRVKGGRSKFGGARTG